MRIRFVGHGADSVNRRNSTANAKLATLTNSYEYSAAHLQSCPSGGLP